MVDLRDPEIQAKAKAGRERFWAQRRAEREARGKQAEGRPPRPAQAAAPPPSRSLGHQFLREQVQRMVGMLEVMATSNTYYTNDNFSNLANFLKKALEGDRG